MQSAGHLGRRREKIGRAAAERRNLTVLFVDIVGSSALARQLDPEDLREILRSFQRCCREAVNRYEGYIARYVGDGLLTYFGFPIAHEDDAERAVNAALHILASVSALSFPHVSQIQIRCGIATGLVIAGDSIGEGPSSEFALVGEAPNLAERLQEHAGANEILISQETRSRLGAAFEMTDLGERAMHGYDRPVQAWRVIRPSIVRSRFDAYRAGQLSPFVGRKSELAALLECYGKAKKGNGQVLGICGEPGIGKSRLVADFCDRIKEEPHQVLLFQCSSYHTSSPWYPLARFVEVAAGIDPANSNPMKMRKLEAWLQRTGDDTWRGAVPFLAATMSIAAQDRYPALDLGQEREKTKAILALLALLRSNAARRPTVLIVEDLHWIDPSSLQLLVLLEQMLKDFSILTILTFRPDYRSPFGDGPNSSSLILSPLEPAEAARLVQSLAIGIALPAGMVDRIVGKTDGIPLFVEEVTRVVLQDAAASGEQRSVGPRGALSVPETLHDSLMARLDQMAPVKAVAQTAAVIGREFKIGLLEAIAPWTAGEVSNALELLCQAGLLFRTRLEAGDTYTFKHALLRDAAYASLLNADRRRLHLRIAEAMRDTFVTIAETTPELLAQHYAKGEESIPAAMYWMKAGQQASKRSAFLEAINHCQSALGMLRALPESSERNGLELQVQQSLASALIAAKGYGADETIQAFKRARELCEIDQNGSAMFAVLNGLVGIHYMRGEFELSRVVAEDLLLRARTLTDPTALLMGHRILGMSLFAMGELTDARRHLESALALYEPALHGPLARVYSHDFKATAQVYLGLTLVLLGETDKGLGNCREALIYAESLKHPHTLCYVLPFIAGSHLASGDAASAQPVVERTIALAAEHGFPQWIAGGLLLRGWTRLELGQFAGGVDDIRNSIRGLEQAGTLVWMQFAQTLLAWGLTETGETRAASHLIDGILGQIGPAGGRWYAAEVHRLKGDLLAAAGASPAEVEACYERAINIAVLQGAVTWRLRALHTLAAFWRANGRVTEARTRLASRRADLEGQP